MKKGRLVEVYYDWQNNLKLLGVALLQKKLRKELPFIPDYIHEGFKNSKFSSKVYRGEE